MVMVSSMGESRSTPSYPTMASPRYGGCVSAFLHFFDWTPAKRFSSTKRLSGNKPEKSFRRSRSFHSDHRSAGKTRMMCQTGGNALLDQLPDNTRAPGVVARLMGLESLPQPQPPRHRRSQSYSGGEPLAQHGTPILLQDLLKQDYKTSKRPLRERLPGSLTKRAPQENSTRKKSVSVWTAFRCRPEVSCVSPAYIDIPTTSRFLYTMARSPRSPFLSRLPPSSQTPQASPAMTKSTYLLEEDIPELSLRASSTGSTVLLQGWPLESQHIVPSDIFHESDYESGVSTSFGSRPTDSASSKPLMGGGSHKVVQRRRRGSSWNGSEGSDTTIEQNVERKVGRGRVASPLEDFVASPRHRSSRYNEPAFKTIRRPASNKSLVANPVTGKRDGARQPLMLQVENSRTSVSQESVLSGASLGSVSSKAPVGLAGRSRASKGGRAGGEKSKEDGLKKKMASRSKEMAPPGKAAPKVRRLKGVTQEENSASRVFPSGSSPSKGPPCVAPQSGDLLDGVNLPKVSYGIRLFGGRKEGDKPLVMKKKGDFSVAEVKTGSPALRQQHESPTLQRFTLKAGGVGGKQTKVEPPRLSSGSTKSQVQDLGDRLKKGNVHGEDMATQSSFAARGEVKVESTTLRSSRRTKLQSKHARAPSVDDVFPELPLDLATSKVDSKEKACPSTDRESLSLNRPVERVLFAEGASSSPEIDFLPDCKDGAGEQISSSPLVDISTGACMLGRLSFALVDYDELPCSGDYGKEAGLLEGLSGSPLVDCGELRSLGEGPPASTSASPIIHSEPCEAQEGDGFAGEVDGLRWQDEIVEASPLSGRCCERSCSGPSISSESLPSDVDPDVDDERNGDAWSSCASYTNLGDCHSPARVFEVTEIDVEPESLNLEHQNSPPTQFVKKILNPQGLDPLVDELAAQPSPVSVLDSPFHDEACTTPESSLTESTHRQSNSEEVVVEELQLSSPPTKVSNSDKIRQALLDISMFHSQEESRPLETQPLPSDDPNDEHTFIQGVLSAAHFLSTPGSSPNWHDKDVAIDPSLFDKLESGDIVEFSCQASGGLWRCDRKLLFDCVNEAFGLTRLWHCQSGGHEKVWLQEEELVWRSSRLRGELVVVEVGKKIEEWRKLAAYAIDSLIERDMSAQFGNWKRFDPEVAEVGLEIESTVWGGILEELVVDMVVSASKRY